MILGIQIKAARALLGMTQSQLAKLTKTSVDTLKRIEKSSANYTGSAELFFSIQKTLENKGIRFDNDGEGEGVKLLSKKKKK